MMNALTLNASPYAVARLLVERVVRALPALGPLRFAARQAAEGDWHAEAWTPGPDLLLGDPWLSRLAGHALGVRAGSTVDTFGPREWIAITDSQGRELLRCELLPQSDFCVWDGLLERVGLGAAAAACPFNWPRPFQAGPSIVRGTHPRSGWIGAVRETREGPALRLECRPLAVAS